MSTANRNQLEPSPHELPVKDTDRAIDVASAECEYTRNKRETRHKARSQSSLHRHPRESVSMQERAELMTHTRVCEVRSRGHRRM